jgi:hypothetical protein
MSPSVTSVEEIDLGIAVAHIALGGARSVFVRCPNGENEQRVDEAEAEVNRLLDRRLTVSR